MYEELEIVMSLARQAGAILLRSYAAPAVTWKEGGSPVTQADRAASAFLTAELKRIFPDDGVLSEEEPDDARRLSRRRVWIIDPLDGTSEFIAQVDEFAVMIGLAVDGSSRLGVIYRPLTDSLYYAVAGLGAFLVESRTARRLRVSPEAHPSAMTIALSRSHQSVAVDEIRRLLGIENSVVSGSLGLKAALICEGRAHVYLQATSRTSQWDICAADVLLAEAGGGMTDVLGRPFRYNHPEARNVFGVVASNGTIHATIVEAARSVLSPRLTETGLLER
jgi:3'(2'),5'-bisphosphate nucleotidase